MWEAILVLPVSAALLSSSPVSTETRSFKSVAEIRAELERLKAESVPPAEAQAQLEAYEEWQRNLWRGGRFGVDPLPVQKSITELKSAAPAYEM